MELTDERLKELREGSSPRVGEWITLCDMAIAHNAAKRVEPVAWARIGVNEEIISLSAFKTDWNTTPLYEAAATPPDLAAKLKEARELLESVVKDTTIDLDVWNKCNDFLARTK